MIGSTGQPKGVMHNFVSMKMTIASFCSNNHCTSKDLYPSYLALAERWIRECHSLYAANQLLFADSLNTIV